MPKELSDISKSVRFNLGASYEAVGNVAGAIAQYESLLSEDVEFGGLQARVKNLAGISPDSQRNKYIALIIERFGEGTLIGMWGEDGRRSEPGSETLSISFGQEHNSLGFDHFIKGRFKVAAEEFSLAAQLDPKFCAALSNLSAMYMVEGSLEQAETRLNAALAIDPDSAVLHNNMGVYYYLKKDLEGASSEFARAIEQDPNLSAAYINYGDVMYLKNSAQNAISLWGKIRSYDPLSPIATRRLAYKTVKT
jgi:tetratricopeptide (TPR) repeat protein